MSSELAAAKSNPGVSVRTASSVQAVVNDQDENQSKIIHSDSNRILIDVSKKSNSNSKESNGETEQKMSTQQTVSEQQLDSDTSPRKLYVETAKLEVGGAGTPWRLSTAGVTYEANNGGLYLSESDGTKISLTQRLRVKQGLSYEYILISSQGTDITDGLADATTGPNFNVKLVRENGVCNKAVESISVVNNLAPKYIAPGSPASFSDFSDKQNNGYPFNGLKQQYVSTPAQPSVTQNYFGNPGDNLGVVFPIAGTFQLCYSRDDINYELLDPIIEVEGSSSNNVRFWCSYTLILKSARQICVTNPTTAGCECKGLVQGFMQSRDYPDDWPNGGANPVKPPYSEPWKLDGTAYVATNHVQDPTDPLKSPGLLTLGIGLGTNQQAGVADVLGEAPPFHLGMTAPLKSCGEGPGSATLEAPFQNKIAVVDPASTTNYMIYSFGADKTITHRTYKLCYCLDFTWNDNALRCDSNDLPSYATEIGYLVLTQIKVFHKNYQISPLPSLKFILVLECGCTIDADSNVGTNCADTCSLSGDKRYKILRQSPSNNLAYFEDSNGCRFGEEADGSSTETDDTNKVIGGQIHPTNCIAAAQCSHAPLSASDQKIVKWTDVQMSAQFHNGIMQQIIYDVCYCDSECTVQSNWWKAGEFLLERLEVVLYKGAVQLNYRTPNTAPAVSNQDFSVVIRAESSKTWSSFSSMLSGESTREMKIIDDTHDSLATTSDCLTLPQSNLVSGHGQINPASVIDYQQPTSLINPDSPKAYEAIRGFVYGRATDNSDPGNPVFVSTIKIAQPGYYSICYCDKSCNAAQNWIIVSREMIAGPILGQKWQVTTGISFNLNVKGHLFHFRNRIIALDSTNELTSCGVDTITPVQRFFGPIEQNAQLSNAAGVRGFDQEGNLLSGVNPIVGFTRDSAAPSRGTVITFTQSHGLKDGDELRLDGVTIVQSAIDWMPTDDQNIQLRTEYQEMFNTVHTVSVLCDYPERLIPGSTTIIPKCHDVLIPLKFSAAEFPYMPPTTNTQINVAFNQGPGWTRTSEEDFLIMKVSTPSPESAGYIICWAEEDQVFTDGAGNTKNIPYTGSYSAPVGYLTVKNPPKMAQSWLSLTTIEPNNPKAQIIVTFVTSSLSQYSQATGSLGLKLVFENLETTGSPTTYTPVIVPYDRNGLEFANAAQKSDAFASLATGQTLADIIKPKDPATAENFMLQQHCGLLFKELWAESEDGFPQPKGCFSFLDNTYHKQMGAKVDPSDSDYPVATDANQLQEAYIFFNERNGLKANTEYQIVLTASFTTQLTKDQPANGAVKVFILDENFEETFSVLESGDCKPEPQDVVPPQEVSDLWTINSDPRLKFDTSGGNTESGLGLEIFDEDDAPSDGMYGISRYCIKTDGVLGSTPTLEKSCIKCEREEDCGNGVVENDAQGIVGVPPNEDINWCRTPIEKECFADQTILSEFPLFKFKLRPQDDSYPLASGQIVKIFMHPLTLWDISGGKCDLFYEPSGGGSVQTVSTCEKGSVTFRTGTMTDRPEQQVNYLKVKIPPSMSIKESNAPKFLVGGTLQAPQYGFFPNHFSAEWTREKDTAGKYLSQEELAATTSVYVRPWIVVARILNRIGESNGNSKPFSLQDNILYIQAIFGSTIIAPMNGDHVSIRYNAPDLSSDAALGKFKCAQIKKGWPIPIDGSSLTTGLDSIDSEEAQSVLVADTNGLYPIEYFMSLPAPTGRGTIGANDHFNNYGIHEIEGNWGTAEAQSYCEVTLLPGMMVVGRTSIFIPYRTQNPEALKIGNSLNTWSLEVYWKNKASVTNPSFSIPKIFTTRRHALIPPFNQQGQREIVPGLGQRILDDANFVPKVAVLGKLSMNLCQPLFYSEGVIVNYVSIFFRTKQQVGSLGESESSAVSTAEVWVDAPINFDVGQYCIVSDLGDIYYSSGVDVPTNKLPRQNPSDKVACIGSGIPGTVPTLVPGSYARAKLSIAGRLLAMTLYGFVLRVSNSPQFNMAQRDSWKFFTYETNLDSSTGASGGVDVVDSSEFTARDNQESPGRPDSDPTGNQPDPWLYDLGQENLSWALYQKDMPSVFNDIDGLYYSTGFLVTLGDLRPNPMKTPTDILIFPIILEMDTVVVNVRILAPHGYKWEFRPAEFKYESTSSGVPEARAVPGAELDFPLSLVPPSPIVKPMNELKVDYMKLGFKKNVRYGLQTKIVVPDYTMSDALNRFSIEFGYNELLISKRYVAGICPAPMVRKLINPSVDYATSLRGARSRLTFKIQTVTDIPRGGGLIIIGPSNFVFDQSCLPIAVEPESTVQSSSSSQSDSGQDPTGAGNSIDADTDLPFDSSCTSEIDGTTSVPTIRITAGSLGIPAKKYAFHLDVTNPSTRVYEVDGDPHAVGSWTFKSFKLSSLPSSTSDGDDILDYETKVPSFGITLPMSMAALVNTPYILCGDNYGNCPKPEYWQYHLPRGLRNDRGGGSTALIFKFSLTCNTNDDTDGKVNADCKKIPDNDPGYSYMKLHAPEGFVFDLNCQVVVESSKVLYANNPTMNTPTGFSTCCGENDVRNWPLAPFGELLGCEGGSTAKPNKARIKFRRGLLAGQVYVFRIGLQSTPIETPSDNTFSIEYNGESSQRFHGYQIWSFTDYSITPRDRAVSNRVGVVEENNVQINIRLHNLLEVRSYFRIVAPTGFEFATLCSQGLKIMPKAGEVTKYCNWEANRTMDEMLIETGVSIKWCIDELMMSRWTSFDAPNVIECRGDERPSNNVQIKLLQDKVMLGKIAYEIFVNVRNPLSIQQDPLPWLIRSFRSTSSGGDELSRELDKTLVPGFAINFQVTVFSLTGIGNAAAAAVVDSGAGADAESSSSSEASSSSSVPTSGTSMRNAGYEVTFRFLMSFPRDIIVGEKIDILAPVGYDLARQGSSACTNYVHLLGFLSRTTPVCGGNMLSFSIVDDRAAAEELISFQLSTSNPSVTPSKNFFKIRVSDMETEAMIASKVFVGYNVIPSLLHMKIETTPVLPNTVSELKNEHSCRGHLKSVYDLIILTNTPCRATSSLTTLHIEFRTRSAANLLRLTGWSFAGIPQVGNDQPTAGSQEPRYSPISIPTNRQQLESYRSPPGLLHEDSNRVKFGYIDSDGLEYPTANPSIAYGITKSNNYNSSEILLVTLKTPQPNDPVTGNTVPDVDGISAGSTVSFSIPRVQLPPIVGVLIWDISTFWVVEKVTTFLPWFIDSHGDSALVEKKDEFKNFRGGFKDNGYMVLGSASITSASTLTPAQFGASSARIVFEIIVDVEVYKDEIMMLTRPPGYKFIADSFVPSSPRLQYSAQELASGLKYDHGVDYIYSTPAPTATATTSTATDDGTDDGTGTGTGGTGGTGATTTTTIVQDTSNQHPERYYFRLVKKIEAKASFSCELLVDVPGKPYSQTYWGVEFWRIRPIVDADGVIISGGGLVDQSPGSGAPLVDTGGIGNYPWNEAASPSEPLIAGMEYPPRWERRLTNDFAFEGFFLVGGMGQVSLNPSLRTPGAIIDLTLTFSIPNRVEAPQQSDKLRLQVRAPPSYRFSASCLISQGDVTRFTKCNGNNNEAQLETSSNSIEGINIPLVLQVTNPPIHSLDANINSWLLQLFRGGESQPSNIGTASGYKIRSMSAEFYGNNRVGGSSSGFMKFRANQMMPKGGVIVIYPPSGGGYSLGCLGVEQISLPAVPTCQEIGVDQPLSLELKQSALQANIEYVFGFGLQNPQNTEQVDAFGFENIWGVMLKSREGNTVDANMNIPGIPLVEIDLDFWAFAWSMPILKQSMATIQIELMARSKIPAGRISGFSIESPEGVMFTDPNQVQVTGLPLAAVRPYRVDGVQLTITLATSSSGGSGGSSNGGGGSDSSSSSSSDSDGSSDGGSGGSSVSSGASSSGSGSSSAGAAIEAGMIRILFSVKNPSTVPSANIWTIKGVGGGGGSGSMTKNVEFLEIIPGYRFGDDSPKPVAGIVAQGSGGNRKYYGGNGIINMMMMSVTMSIMCLKLVTVFVNNNMVI